MPALFIASTEFVDAAADAGACAGLPDPAAHLRCPPDPGPDRRRTAGLRRRRGRRARSRVLTTRATPSNEGGTEHHHALLPPPRSAHRVAGRDEDEYEAAYREGWMSTLAKSNGAAPALLHEARARHRSARTTSSPRHRVHRRRGVGAFRPADSARRPARGRAHGPVAPRTCTAKLLPAEWSPRRSRSTSRTSPRRGEHDQTLFMEDTAWPHAGMLEDYLEAARDNYAPSLAEGRHGGRSLLELQAVFALGLGRRRRARSHPWQRVTRPAGIARPVHVGGAGRAPRPGHLDARRAARARRLGEPPPAHRALVPRSSDAAPSWSTAFRTRPACGTRCAPSSLCSDVEILAAARLRQARPGRLRPRPRRPTRVGSRTRSPGSASPSISSRTTGVRCSRNGSRRSTRPDPHARVWSGPCDETYTWHAMAQAWQTPEVGEQIVDGMLGCRRRTSPPASRPGGAPADLATEQAEPIDAEMARCILALYRSAVTVGAGVATRRRRHARAARGRVPRRRRSVRRARRSPSGRARSTPP